MCVVHQILVGADKRQPLRVSVSEFHPIFICVRSLFLVDRPVCERVTFYRRCRGQPGKGLCDWYALLCSLDAVLGGDEEYDMNLVLKSINDCSRCVSACWREPECGALLRPPVWERNVLIIIRHLNYCYPKGWKLCWKQNQISVLERSCGGLSASIMYRFVGATYDIFE